MPVTRSYLQQFEEKLNAIRKKINELKNKIIGSPSEKKNKAKDDVKHLEKKEKHIRNKLKKSKLATEEEEVKKYFEDMINDIKEDLEKISSYYRDRTP